MKPKAIYAGDHSAYKSVTGCNNRNCGNCSDCGSKTKSNPCPQNPCVPKVEPKTMCIEFVQPCRITDSGTGEIREIFASHVEKVSMYVEPHIAQMYIDCGKAVPCGYYGSGCTPGKDGKPGATKEEILSCLCAAWDINAAKQQPYGE